MEKQSRHGKKEKTVNGLNLILSKMAELVMFAATSSAGTASGFGADQPDAPKELKREEETCYGTKRR